MTKALLVMALAAFAIAGPGKSYVSLEKLPPLMANAGAEASFRVVLNVTKNFHIQANPASAKNLIPTTVTLESLEGIEWGNPVYPPGKPYRLIGAAEDISTYDGKVSILVPFAARASQKKIEQTVKGTVRFQACNDKTCFFPVSLPFSVPMKIR